MKNAFVIDMGSNSIRLMQAQEEEGRVHCLQKWLIAARLGEKPAGSTALTPAAIARGADAVAEFVEKARALDDSAPIFAFATSAVRDAQNRDELLREIWRRTGLAVEVLSGEQEACLGAAGALGGQDGGLLDIGGGSTEIVLCRGGKIAFARSLNIGCVRAKTLFREGAAAVGDWARAAFSDCPLPETPPFAAIGGTPTALAAAALGLSAYDPKKVDGYRLDAPQLRALTEALAPLSPAERAARYCMDARRGEVILFGAAILQAFFAAYGVREVRVSESDNLEGYLMEKLHQGIL